MRPVVLVHGGAGPIPRSRHEAARAGCLAAARAGFRALAQGADALTAVVEAVAVLEDDPQFNAGRGSVLNRDGLVEMDAAVMRGYDRALGAVAAVSRIRSPVRLAREVLGTEHVLLVGPGAEALGRERGLPEADPGWFVTEARREQLARHLAGRGEPGIGTVGAVALDRTGGLAAATSTGGKVGKHPGRVGDTPIAGAGTYADPGGAASGTGDGEYFVRAITCFAAVQAIAAHGAMAAARLGLERVADLGGQGGLILVAPRGELGIACNTGSMPHGWVRVDEEGTGI